MAKSARTRSAKALKLRIDQVRLVDFRIVALKCERFVRPEDAPKGRFKTSVQSSVSVVDGSSDTRPSLVIASDLEIEGRKSEDENSAKNDAIGPKSFSIRLTSEALFDIRVDRRVTPSDTSAELVTLLYLQVHPLLIARVRSLALDMGFKGVRPELGFDSSNAIVKQVKPVAARRKLPELPLKP